MDVLQVLAEFFVAVFLLGVVGSFVVIVITFIEDIELLFEDEESSTSQIR